MQFQVHKHFDDGSEDDGPAPIQPAQQAPPQANKGQRLTTRESEILVGLARWIGYSLLMAAFLAPFLTGFQLVGGALLFGHFSAQINSLKQ